LYDAAVGVLTSIWGAVAAGRARTAVDIAEYPRQACGEGVIERITQRRDRVEVKLLLADGTGAAARLDRHRADWLELRAGDVVGVVPLPAAPSVSA
jgi:hypothetical protein